MAIWELPVKNLATPFAPAMSISYKKRSVYFHNPMTFSAHIGCFFVHNFHLNLWPWPSTIWPCRCLNNKEIDTSNTPTNS